MEIITDIGSDMIGEYRYNSILSIRNMFNAIQQPSPNCLDEKGMNPLVEHPIFFGCYDWHSSVHSHYSLIWLCQSQVDCVLKKDVIQYITTTFSFELADLELASLQRKESSWECPYGLSWFLKLYSLLCLEYPDIASPLKSLHAEIEFRLMNWIYTLDTHSVNRSGLHDNSAFSLLLILESCESIPNSYSLRSAALSAARTIYLGDVLESDSSRHHQVFEKSRPFLSPTLSEAELISYCYAIGPCDPFLPKDFDSLPFCSWVVKAVDNDVLFGSPDCSGDPADKTKCHTCGLNLSKATSLAVVARALLPAAISTCEPWPQHPDSLGSESDATICSDADGVNEDNQNLDVHCRNIVLHSPTSMTSKYINSGVLLTPGTSKIIANCYRESHLTLSHRHQTSRIVGNMSSCMTSGMISCDAPDGALGKRCVVPLSTVRSIMHSAVDHYKASVCYLNSGHFMGDHWLNTFAIRAIAGIQSFIILIYLKLFSTTALTNI